ncbi:hypothetical protein ABVK25_005290 [Lepraria finkii]|uniref:catalase n=1 Tax=Lepraria finkii TaxID=1340010 RepID=A0ABR4BAU5_9LECA
MTLCCKAATSSTSTPSSPDSASTGKNFPSTSQSAPIMNQNRDGQGQHRITAGSIGYWPNRKEAVPSAKPSECGYVDYPEKIAGTKVRLESKKFKDHTSQAQLFWKSQTPPEKRHLIAALGFELDHCDDPIVYNRIVERLCDIDIELSQAVAEKAGAPTPTKQGRSNAGKKTNLSVTAYNAPKPTIASRCVAILVGDVYDSVTFQWGLRSSQGSKSFPVCRRSQAPDRLRRRREQKRQRHPARPPHRGHAIHHVRFKSSSQVVRTSRRSASKVALCTGFVRLLAT